MKELQEIVRRMLSGAGPWVLATLVNVEGSSYRRPGARALIDRQGNRLGSISGGCLEQDLLARAAQVAGTGAAQVAVYDTTSENDVIWGVGLGCHGVVHVLLEDVPAPPAWAVRAAQAFEGGGSCRIGSVWNGADQGRLGTALGEQITPVEDQRVFWQEITAPVGLAVFGAGDDAQPLVGMAAALGWDVTVADPRPAYPTPQRFPAARRVLSGTVEELAAAVMEPRDRVHLAVIMTHHYVHDLPLLAAILPRPLAYVGLLGPRQRAERLLQDLARGGLEITPEMRRRLHAPVGLDVGADGADEVALSILAEMKATLGGRDGRPLRECRGPIHPHD